MPCVLSDLEEMDDRTFDAVILRAIRRDDGAAARSHLEAGRPIYYCDDAVPSRMVREWPNGHKEIVQVMDDGSVKVHGRLNLLVVNIDVERE
jgi:hypothetical protein